MMQYFSTHVYLFFGKEYGLLIQAYTRSLKKGKLKVTVICISHYRRLTSPFPLISSCCPTSDSMPMVFGM